jgi:hypothetical protein
MRTAHENYACVRVLSDCLPQKTDAIRTGHTKVADDELKEFRREHRKRFHGARRSGGMVSPRFQLMLDAFADVILIVED